MDGGSADIAGANICQYVLVRRSCASMHPRHTVHPVHNKKAAEAALSESNIFLLLLG